MLSQGKAEREITKAYKSASRSQRKRGRAWYTEAHNLCLTLAEHNRVSLAQVAGVMAALSPQCPWSENVRATIAMVRTGQTGTTICYKANVSKAHDILQGNAPEVVLGGEKVRAFFENILDPQRSQAVTIDTHAARAAYGKTDLSAKEIQAVFRKPLNGVIQEAYRAVAKRYRMIPCELQAVVWLQVREALTARPVDTQLTYIK